MSTITKERVAQFIKNPLDNGLTRGEQMELARIALASLEAEIHSYTFEDDPRPLYTAPPAPIEAEPVAYMWDSDRKDVDAAGYYRPEHKIFAESSVKRYGGKVVPLYAAPPATVDKNPLREFAMEYIESWDLGMAGDSSLLASARKAIADSEILLPAPVSVPDEAYSDDCPDLYPSQPDAWAAGWNACRAAMLQGADTELQRKAAIHDALCEKYNVESLSDFVDWQRNHIAELEAAPPAPVGQGETAVMPDYPGYALTQRECYQAGKKAGLAEAGNSPVIPDGWVACSERMPTKQDGTVFLTWNGQYIGKELFLMGSFQCLKPEIITHWMPLPAAPQQEVKNG